MNAVGASLLLSLCQGGAAEGSACLFAVGAEGDVVDSAFKESLHVALRLIWEDEIKISDPSRHGVINVVEVHC